jgi:aryl-alcohol dehydrogenase (NADP+)
MDDLVRQGKVRYIAYSNCRAWQICKALWVSELHHLSRFECVQTPYNLITRENEYELLSFCASEGLGVCVYNPLAAGFLTGKHDPTKPPAEGTRFADKAEGEEYRERYWLANNFEAVAGIKKIADKHDRIMAQFALAWTLSNEAVTAAICGASSTKQLGENLGATEIKLSQEELDACDEAWHKIRPPRYLYGR